ncbi:hypothetical protein QGM71_16255 [Virgibacillus sp. C22-A2]|uniref:Cxxc_20_cxxc protein n=1 Tax=Virgibacillus tibetensis TaxID=3042313 RepID=A0ABU6KJI4_9BACI|nr:hypothetical protein [Virgibacillus sp. C22-A2]
MPICAHCGKRWSYRETLKKSFRIKMICAYCHEGNYYSARGRMKSTIIPVVVSPFILFSSILLDLSVTWVTVLAIVLLVIILSVTPFWIELSKEEEALW